VRYIIARLKFDTYYHNDLSESNDKH
jgi:hypothetical protein